MRSAAFSNASHILNECRCLSLEEFPKIDRPKTVEEHYCQVFLHCVQAVINFVTRVDGYAFQTSKNPAAERESLLATARSRSSIW